MGKLPSVPVDQAAVDERGGREIAHTSQSIELEWAKTIPAGRALASIATASFSAMREPTAMTPTTQQAKRQAHLHTSLLRVARLPYTVVTGRRPWCLVCVPYMYM